MDSKFVGVGLLIVSLCAVTVFLVVCAVNGVFDNNTNSKTATSAEGALETHQTLENDIAATANLSDWMNDAMFFDEEEPELEPVVETVDKKVVSYKVSTIEKDIRIVFLDEEGDLLSGRKFKMDVAGLGEYTDNDRDGIIYIEDVSPGDYSIQMESIYGYAVPENATSVNVKAAIEYKAVADISYLIKTEADIDALAEDTSVKGKAEELEGNSEIKTIEGALFGIDVSKWNNEIDWIKVKESGVQYAIIRCGYRGSKTGAIVEDPYFRANIEGAIEAGIPVGIYFFTQAVDEREAVEEASAVVSLIKDYKITYPVFIDTESAGGEGRADSLEVEQRTKVMEAFCETIRSGKYTAGIYASKNWFNNRLDVSKLSTSNVTWLAEYNDKATYTGTYHMWQYSSAGRIPGIEGRVDMNLSYLDVSGKVAAKQDDKDKDSDEGSEDSKDIKNKEQSEDGQVDSRDM